MAERGRGRKGRSRGQRRDGSRGRSDQGSVGRDDDYDRTVEMAGELSLGESSSSASSPATTPKETTRQASKPAEEGVVPEGVEFLPEPELPPGPGASATAREPKGGKIIERYTISGATSSAPLIEGSNLYPPSRPAQGGVGTRGRPIMLRINFFPIILPKDKIHMYHVDVYDDNKKSEDKSVRQKFVCNSVMENLIRTFREDFKGEMPVYDRQAALFTKKPLWGGSSSKEYTVNWLDSENGDRKRTNRVVIAHAAEVDLSMIQEFINRKRPYTTAVDRQDEFDKGRTAINAFEVILKQLPQSRHVNVMRSFYFKPHQGEPFNLGEGCDIWEGYFQSLRPGQWKPFINLNTSVSAMMKDINLIDFICEATKTNSPHEAMRKRRDLQRLLCNLKISTRHQGFKRVCKVNNTARQVFGKPPSQQVFKGNGGGDTTTEKYFAEKYKMRLKYPDLPCIMVGNKGTAIPLEVCWIVQGQHKSGKLTGDQTAAVIKFSAKPAYEREKIIEQIARQELVTNDPLLNHYGIKPSNRMVEVEGRVLDTPSIVYANKNLVPRDGSWNLQGVVFTGVKPMERWVIVDFINARDNLDQFVREIQIVGRGSGMMIQDPMDVSTPRIDGRDDEYRVKDKVRAELVNIYKRNRDVQMIVVFINSKPFPLENTVMYGHIKAVCDSELGVNSQCVREKNIFRVNKSTIANICLKMNAKLGGINHIVDMAPTPSAHLFKKPIMFIGADVNHPGVGADEYTPSIAAMVGSLDSKLGKYASSVRFQKHYRSVAHDTRNGQVIKRKDRLEMIDKFGDMFIEQIESFKQFCKGHLPERIIYYRDGVSEGQFTHVLQWELKAMREACGKIQANYQPAITIICVQKRHHLRMFCDKRDQVGRGGNVPPGTYVDKEVTHPFEFDFYLCSHCGLQGTSRPTHYHVLWDENNFNADSLQALTYQLCHTYAKATKAVSIPAPVYYAHWVAKRAAMSATFKDDDSSSISSGSSGDLEKWDEMRKPMLIEKGLMYWA